LYQSIGALIVQKKEKFGWGKSVVEQLSKDLKILFPTAIGYSVQNLWYMRQLFLEYQGFPNLQKLVGEIPWGHNLLIIAKLKDENERQFYIKSSIDMKWSRDVLLNQIKANTYQRQAIATKQHNFKETLPAHVAEQANEAIKDSYILEFWESENPC
jgi:predicted nuclease of restriction endonuclease-like (RecB) superfamily